MEIKAELILPYTEKERLNFIASQNHRLGYEIRQVEGTWEEEKQVPCMKTVVEIIQEPIFDDEGNPVLDEEGNPTYKDIEVTREVQETETIVEIVKQPKYDEDGNLVFDENGEQVLEDVEVEKEIPKYRTEYITHTGYNLQAWGYTEEELAQQKQEQLAKEFFKTSLGYVKRKVTMTTGEIRDFLFDIKPTLQVGIPIITYNLDSTQNRGVIVTEAFLKECDAQVYFDFYGSYPNIEGGEVKNENTTDTTTDI